MGYHHTQSTLDEIVVDMKGGRFSRVKTLDGLHILHFNSKAIEKSIENEMVRLNTNLLQPMPEVSCDPSHVTIALLNVRSILATLPDIRADNSLRLVLL